MTITRILHLLEVTNITAKKLTEDTQLSSSAVSEWKKGKATPSTDAIVKISNYFSVPIDYLLGTGVYKNWGEIIQNKDSIWNAIQFSDLAKFCLATDDGKSVSALFYEALYTEPDDLAMIRLFSWAIKSVCFLPHTQTAMEPSYVEAIITFSEGLYLLLRATPAVSTPENAKVLHLAGSVDEFLNRVQNPRKYALSEDEWRLICLYRLLNNYGKGEVMAAVRDMSRKTDFTEPE